MLKSQKSSCSKFAHLSVVSSRQRSYDWLRCEGKGRGSTMKLYHKVFKSHADMSVYLANMDPLISYDEELWFVGSHCKRSV